MNIAFSLVALFIISVAAIFNRTDTNLLAETSQKTDVLSESTSEPTASPTPAQSPRSTNNTPVSTTPPVSNGKISDYKYPNSQTLSSSAVILSQKSSDDPQAITDWYKEKINSQGFNIKSFVQTKTNGNVLNKLVGAKGDVQVSIDISRTAAEQSTTIEVKLD